jgi:hypothetical protein
MPLSIKHALAAALARKQVPDFKGGDLGDLAHQLGLERPITATQLLAALEALPTAVVTLRLPDVQTPGGVTATGALGLQADGMWSFKGHVHNPSGGIDYVYTATLLDVKDADGKMPVFFQSDSLFNEFTSSDGDFQKDGFSELVAEQWDAAKRSRLYAYLWDEDDPGDQLLETLSGIAIVIGGALGGGAALVSAPGPDDTPADNTPICSWSGGQGGSMQGCFRTR